MALFGAGQGNVGLNKERRCFFSSDEKFVCRGRIVHSAYILLEKAVASWRSSANLQDKNHLSYTVRPCLSFS